jgi:hypothetical protein
VRFFENEIELPDRLTKQPAAAAGGHRHHRQRGAGRLLIDSPFHGT